MSSEVYSKTVIVLHNVSSVHRLLELVRIATGFGFKHIVLTKITGAAAQQGIPEAFRVALKSNSNIVVLNELNDVLEILAVRQLYFLCCETGQLQLKELIESVRSTNDKVALVVNGADTPFLPRELQLGKTVRVTQYSIPATGLLAIVLSRILEEPH